MTKKDYIVVATAIAATLKAANSETPTPAQARAVKRFYEVLLYKLEQAFIADNNRFDTERFERFISEHT